MTHFSDKVFTNADQVVVPYDGSTVTWRPSAYALVIRDNALLVMKNKHEKLYDIPGGGIELGETIQEAIERESMEEAGAKVKIGELICVVEDWFQHASGKFYQTLQLFYVSELSGKLTEPTAGTTELVKFVSFSELDQYPLPKAVQTAISKLKTFKQGVDHIQLPIA